MSTIEHDLAQIRQAVYGREVREAIADGIEHCYDDVSTSTTLADGAAERANTAAARSEGINEELGDNADALVLVQDTQPVEEFNKLWIKPGSEEYQVPTYGEFESLAEVVGGVGNAITPYKESAMQATSGYSAGDLVLVGSGLYRTIAEIAEDDALVIGTNVAVTTLREYATGSGLATGTNSHAEGTDSVASGVNSHAEGSATEASGTGSHTEGFYTQATGVGSHVEGYGSEASGQYSHAEGAGTTASGTSSHAEGDNTIANHKGQHVFGEYNIADPSSANAGTRGNYVEIVGNGNDSARSNARTLDWNGNETLSGGLVLHAGSQSELNVSEAVADLKGAINPLGISKDFSIDAFGSPTSYTIHGDFKSSDTFRIKCEFTKTGTGAYNCAVKDSANTNIKVFYGDGTDDITLAADTSILTFVLGKADTITALSAALSVSSKVFIELEDIENELDAHDTDIKTLANMVSESVAIAQMLESGYWAFSDGAAGSSQNYARSVGYLPKDAQRISIAQSYGFYICLLAFNSGSYVGTWNHITNVFETISSLDSAHGDFSYDLATISKTYPTYRYKIDVRAVTVTGAIDPATVGSYIYLSVPNVGARIVTVDKNGNGDFTKLVDAINYATLFMDATVYVGKGEWDILDELGAAYLSAVSASKNGLVLKNRIRLIFASDSVVKADYTGSDTNVMTYLSVFNSGEYGFTLENANIHATKIRYCVHDERGSNTDIYHNYYKNCTMYLDNTENTAFTGIQCIGGGLGQDGEIVIDGCTFESLNKWGGIVSWHNTGASTGKSKILVKDCYFKGHGTFRFSWYGSSTDISIALVCGCSLGGEIVHRAENESAVVENTEIIGWNNIVRT